MFVYFYTFFYTFLILFYVYLYVYLFVYSYILSLDREVDLASLFVTPLTYEGLLDDIMGIENGTVWLDASLLDEENPGLPSPESTGVKRSLRLDQRDVIFGEIRNLYVDRYAAHLKSRLVEHKQIRTNFRENKNQTITDIYNMHKQVPIIQETYKSISLHINLAQLIKRQSEGMEFRDLWQFERGVLEGDTSLDQIEDLICGDVARTELYRILRLLCLMSVTNGGIRAAKLDPVRKLIIQTYGYEHMYTMLNLEKAGLIRRKETVFEGTSVWQAVRKSLALVGDNPTSSSTGGSSSNSAGSGGVEGTMKSITSLYSDPSYVAAGFTPLSVRIVQSLVAKSQRGARTGPPLPSWTITREALRSLMGEVSVVEVTQLKHAADELSSALTRTQMEQVNTLTQPSSASSASAGLFSSLSPAAMLNASLLSSANTASSTAAASGVTPAAAQLQVPTNKPVMLLCILGGVTLLEVAAFRYLSNDPKFPFEIVLTSTCVTNGSKFIRALAHDEV